MIMDEYKRRNNRYTQTSKFLTYTFIVTVLPSLDPPYTLTIQNEKAIPQPT